MKVDVGFPCATQNELDEREAHALVKNGVACVAEGANMPCTPGAVRIFHDNRVLFAPGKASNAGGVAVSGLEMTQNSIRDQWSAEEVDQRLHRIMIAHPQDLRRDRRGLGPPGRLRVRGERRRLHEGRDGDARAGGRVGTAGFRPPGGLQAS